VPNRSQVPPLLDAYHIPQYPSASVWSPYHPDQPVRDYSVTRITVTPRESIATTNPLSHTTRDGWRIHEGEFNSQADGGWLNQVMRFVGWVREQVALRQSRLGGLLQAEETLGGEGGRIKSETRALHGE
jgi:hypothetical protein